jgi:hypothetical protein
MTDLRQREIDELERWFRLVAPLRMVNGQLE